MEAPSMDRLLADIELPERPNEIEVASVGMKPAKAGPAGMMFEEAAVAEEMLAEPASASKLSEAARSTGMQGRSYGYSRSTAQTSQLQQSCSIVSRAMKLRIKMQAAISQEFQQRVRANL